MPRSLTPIRITTSVFLPMRPSTAGTPEFTIQEYPILFFADQNSFSRLSTYICMPTVLESPIKTVRVLCRAEEGSLSGRIRSR